MKIEQNLSRDLKRIENKLVEVFQPINPPAAFVADLRDRLDQEMIKKNKSRKVRNRLLVAGGLLGLVALVVTVIRKLTSWEKLAASFMKNLPRIRKREQAASF